MLEAIISFAAKGNPGAAVVLTQLATGEGSSEVRSVKKRTQFLMYVTTVLEVHGSPIWVIYKDICGQSIDRFIEFFSVIPYSELHSMAEDMEVAENSAYAQFTATVKKYALLYQYYKQFKDATPGVPTADAEKG